MKFFSEIWQFLKEEKIWWITPIVIIIIALIILALVYKNSGQTPFIYHIN